MYDVNISHPLSTGRLANARKPNPLPVLNAAWASKVSHFRSFMQQAGPRCSLLPVPISTLGGWHPEAHRAILSMESGIASRAFSRARSIHLQRYAALLAACLLSGRVGNAWNGDIAVERVLLCTITGRAPLCDVVPLFH